MTVSITELSATSTLLDDCQHYRAVCNQYFIVSRLIVSRLIMNAVIIHHSTDDINIALGVQIHLKACPCMHDIVQLMV